LSCCGWKKIYVLSIAASEKVEREENGVRKVILIVLCFMFLIIFLLHGMSNCNITQQHIKKTN